MINQMYQDHFVCFLAHLLVLDFVFEYLQYYVNVANFVLFQSYLYWKDLD